MASRPCESEPRRPHHPYLNTLVLFANKVTVHQPLSFDALEGFVGALAVRYLTRVVAEIELA